MACRFLKSRSLFLYILSVYLIKLSLLSQSLNTYLYSTQTYLIVIASYLYPLFLFNYISLHCSVSIGLKRLVVVGLRFGCCYLFLGVVFGCDFLLRKLFYHGFGSIYMFFVVFGGFSLGKRRFF